MLVYNPMGALHLLLRRTSRVRRWRELLVDPCRRGVEVAGLAILNQLPKGVQAKAGTRCGDSPTPTLLHHKGRQARRAERLQRRLEPRALGQGALAIPA
ncbi:MAG: hypothetical protein K0S96_1702 [Geminicoccaceae bacterium]|nr:hypothetical protein [Geminicoccaceae bacterium]